MLLRTSTPSLQHSTNSSRRKCSQPCRSPAAVLPARGRKAGIAAAAVAAAAAAAPAMRGTVCRSAAGGDAGSSSSSREPPQPAAGANSSSSPAHGFSDAELRQLWDSVSRSLLKLGKSGLSPTHVNSLQELLTAHKLVKVELNGARSDADVEAAAAELERQIGGTGRLLQTKGRTLLVASSSSSSEELLARAEASSASTAVWKAKRQIKKAEAAAKREASL